MFDNVTVNLDEILEALLAADEIACDIETTDLDMRECRVTSIQFAVMKDGEPVGWVINLDEQITLPLLAKKFEPVLKNRKKRIIFHNASFDVHVLALRGFHFSTNLGDTMIMAWLHDEDRKRHGSYGLKECVLKYLNYQMATYEEARSLFGCMDDYAADDAKQTLRLYHFFRKKLSEVNLVDWFERVEMPVTRILIEAEMRGVQIDGEQLKIVKKDCYAKLAEIQEEIYKLAGYSFDIASPKQLSRVLFDELKIGVGSNGINMFSERGKNNDWSTSNEVLEAMKRAGHKIADLLLDFREYNTRLNVFINPLLERFYYSPIIHPRFVQTATVTGRFASRDPNYQNLPRKGGIRKAFIARPEYKIIRADYCVAEGTSVELERGSCAIENVLPGDQVILEDGSKACVDKVIDRGVLPIVEIRTSRGYALKATKLHRIRVVDANGDYIWKRIGDLDIQNDYVAIQPGSGSGEIQKLPPIVFTHRNNKRINWPTELNEKVAELFGYWVGDGTFGFYEGGNKSSHVAAVVSGDDSDVFKWLEERQLELFSSAHVQKFYDKGAWGTKISSKPLVIWARTIGLAKDNIPKLLFKSPPAVIRSFLRGYFEADGSVGERSNGQRISCSSSRKTMITSVQLLLLKSGIPSTIRECEYLVEGKKHIGWQLNIPTTFAKDFADKIGFIGGRKKRQLEDYISYCDVCPSLGSYPNLRQKVRDLKLTGEVRRLLNNTASLGRPVTRNLARQLKEKNPDVYSKLELYRIAEYNTYFDEIVSIEEVESSQVYDLSIPGPMTYISNGFVSHNSQAELRLMAHMSDDPVMIDIYRNNGDIHKKTADSCGVSRQAAKALNFGLIYRMSAKRLQSQLALQGILISIEDAQSYVKRYFSTYSRVRHYHQNVERKVKERLAENGEFGWVKTLGGRYRRLEKAFLENPELQYTAITQAINTTIQGGVADLIKEAMVVIQNIFKEKGWLDPENGVWDAFIQGQVHDELMVECKEQIVDEVKAIVVRELEAAGEKYRIKVPMTADAAIVEHLEK